MCLGLTSCCRSALVGKKLARIWQVSDGDGALSPVTVQSVPWLGGSVGRLWLFAAKNIIPDSIAVIQLTD